jgi:hypothetical protein
LALLAEMQSAENDIIVGLIYKQSCICTQQGRFRVTNAWAIAKVAERWLGTSRKLRAIGAALVGGRVQRGHAVKSGVFCGFLRCKVTVKVRCFDALICGSQPGAAVEARRRKTYRSAAFWHAKCL